MKAQLAVASLLFAALLPAQSPPGSISLPKPDGLEMALGEALRARQSVRSFDPARKVSRAQLATLLWAANGITRPDPAHAQGGKRTAPAAFEAYAIDVYVTSAEGTFVYSPKDHALVPYAPFAAKDFRGEIPRSDWLKDAPVLVLLIANLDRYPANVRPERRRDYSHADAAVIGENFCLAATALGLGTVLTADAKPEAGAVLGLKEEQKVVFILPVGYGKEEKGK